MLLQTCMVDFLLQNPKDDILKTADNQTTSPVIYFYCMGIKWKVFSPNILFRVPKYKKVLQVWTTRGWISDDSFILGWTINQSTRHRLVCYKSVEIPKADFITVTNWPNWIGFPMGSQTPVILLDLRVLPLCMISTVFTLLSNVCLLNFTWLQQKRFKPQGSCVESSSSSWFTMLPVGLSVEILDKSGGPHGGKLVFVSPVFF